MGQKMNLKPAHNWLKLFLRLFYLQPTMNEMNHKKLDLDLIPSVSRKIQEIYFSNYPDRYKKLKTSFVLIVSRGIRDLTGTCKAPSG